MVHTVEPPLEYPEETVFYIVYQSATLTSKNILRIYVFDYELVRRIAVRETKAPKTKTYIY